MEIPTKKEAGCLGVVVIFTPRAVVFPPKPNGPMFSWLIWVKRVSSKSFNCSIGLVSFKFLRSCFLDRWATSSIFPPAAMPRMYGGHPLPWALKIASMAHFLMPFRFLCAFSFWLGNW